MPEKLVESRYFFGSIILFYLFVAYRSTGYHNPDEHYQIIEFANYKLGNTKLNELAWEYRAKIRSGLQPFVCFVLIKTLLFFGITSPYTLAFLFRGLTAVACLLTIRYFVGSYKKQIHPRNYTFFVITSYLLWFLPYVNVRFGSETWSGMFLLLGIGLIAGNQLKFSVFRILAIGATLGFAVLFRYQSAVAVMGMIAWLLVIRRVKLKNIGILGGSLAVVMLIGVLIDRWLYGEFTFAMYNYFEANILHGVASNYGTSPWYEMIVYMAMGPSIIGFLILVAYLILIVYEPKNILLWCTLPFILIHSIVPHKELRFLFPLVNLVPIILIFGYQKFTIKVGQVNQTVKYLVVFFFIIANLAGIYVIISRGAGRAKVAVTQFIDQNYGERTIKLFYTEGANPYFDWKFPTETFYRPHNINFNQISSVWEPNFIEKIDTAELNLLLIRKEDIFGERTAALLKKLDLVLIYQNIPVTTQFINKFYDSDLNNNALFLYEFKER